MNRCITCGKIVTRRKAQNIVEYEEHKYLVCCPLCQKEFDRDPKYNISVAQSVLGDYALKAHSLTSSQNNKIEDNLSDNLRLLKNLQTGFDEIHRLYGELYRQFALIYSSGGLEGLRNVLKDHRKIMDSLQEKITVHAGVCRYVVSVAESSTMNYDLARK